ncbi:MAG TPA: hypothetical protein VMW51_01875 [Terriglobia bacterium]|nr:hypothetical protein [Terriglobia bacterium]
MPNPFKRTESDFLRDRTKPNPTFKPPGGIEALRGRPAVLLTLALLAGGFVFLYLNLFYLPNTPIHLFVDQVTLLFDARRMFDGQMIYRDFFQFTLPATQLVYFSLFKIFGVRTWIPNAMLIVLGVSTMGLMILISRKVLPGRVAYLPALLFLVVPFRSQFDATHHWYSTLAVMGALALLMEARTPARLAGAGALMGLSTCFTQTRGLPAAAAVALFLVWEARRNGTGLRKFWKSQFQLWWPFFAVLIGFNAYFAWETGLGKFLSDTILFGLRYYPTFAWNTYRVYMIDVPAFHPWYRLPALAIFLSIHLLIPLIYILFFVRYWTTRQESPAQPWDRLVLISLTGFFIFLGVVGAPSWLRICAVSPPGVILFVWFWNSPGRTRGLRMKSVWILALLVALGECAEREVRWHQDLNLPTGRVAMMNREHFESVQYFLRRTRPGDYFFGDEMYNYLLDLRDPARVPYITGSDYTRPRQVRNIIEGLEDHPVQFVLWSYELEMPPPRYGGSNHLGPLHHYLESHYHAVKTFPDGTIVLERNGSKPALASPTP